MTLPEILESLQSTTIATTIQESQYGFPLVVGVHILGLSLSVGTLVWVDLRLLGVALTRSPVSYVYRGLAPWFLFGFAMMLVSGTMLFTAYATAAYSNTYFRIKMSALALAAANALFFHAVTQRAQTGWDDSPRPPLGARVAGFTSLVLWAVVIFSGRMMSYTVFSSP
jgi:hypothetical protein